MEEYLDAFAECGRDGADKMPDEKKCPHESVKQDMEKLSKKDWMEEFMFLGLRMMQGVSKQEFTRSFGSEMNTVYGETLHQWIEQGMLVEEGDSVRLTDAGIDVSNVVLADFLLDDATV